MDYFSDETQDLFDRADQAIQRSKEIVKQARQIRAVGKLNLKRQRARLIFDRMHRYESNSPEQDPDIQANKL
jgi:hypothetical protein